MNTINASIALKAMAAVSLSLLCATAPAGPTNSISRIGADISEYISRASDAFDAGDAARARIELRRARAALVKAQTLVLGMATNPSTGIDQESRTVSPFDEMTSMQNQIDQMFEDTL